jgi:hypothetical protein
MTMAYLCMDLLMLESVRLLSSAEDPGSSAALEAVGVRVGRQLAERLELLN